MKSATQKDFIAFINRLFRHYNKELFDNKLKNPSIQVIPTKKFGVRFESPADIHIGRGFQDQNRDSITLDLIIAMIYLKNFKNGGSTTVNSYHTASFATIATQAGLFVQKLDYRGWAKLSFRELTGRMKEPNTDAYLRRDEAITQAPWDNEKFALFQKEMTLHPANKQCKKFLLKYVCHCPKPHNRIRSGRRPDGPNPLNLLCLNCKQIFKHED